MRRVRPSKLLLIIALFALAGAVYHVRGTVATLSDQVASIETHFSAGTWDEGWDRSSLEVIDQGWSCESGGTLWVTVLNSGDGAMRRPVGVHLWYAPQGNPKRVGTMLSTSALPALGPGDSATINAAPSEGFGKYMFAVEQRPGHPGSDLIWSESIKYDETLCGSLPDDGEDDTEDPADPGDGGEDPPEDANQAPLALDDEYIMTPDTLLEVIPPGVLGNDSEPDGDALQAVLDKPPKSGVLALNADGSFSFAPDPGFEGRVRFTYHVTDGQAESGKARVTIIVRAP